MKNEILPRIQRQMLHAETLGFIHPDSGNYREFHAPMPHDMGDALKMLKLMDIKDKKLDMEKN